MARRRIVMVSSTSLDLPEHRKQVLDACLYEKMFPNMMEHLPASSAGAVAESLRLVNEADVYLGIFAHRYGYVPDGHAVSITEMEYDRAVERGLPRLIFVIHSDHLAIPQHRDADPGSAARLEALKARLLKSNVVNFFSSPDDLGKKVIHSLGAHARRVPAKTPRVADAPAPPEAYKAHRYPLMQVQGLVGRRKELSLLTDWIANPKSEFHSARVLALVAVGGMGKSALAWKWFEDYAPSQKAAGVAGRMWWSFYENDSWFENFLIHSLAYVSRRSFIQLRQLEPEERVRRLLDILDREPFLLVLDGVERLLLAYARLDADRLSDEALDEQTAHVLPAQGLPAGASRSPTDQHRLRKTADVRAGMFLQRLAGVRGSRILLTTRLAPADLQIDGQEQRPGSAVFALAGLEDPDALALWKMRGGQVSDAVLSVLHRCDNHPLVIQALASAVARDRRTRGDFNRWQLLRSNFNPFSLPLVQSKSHVLAFALEGLSERARRTLQVVAAFSMPTTYDTLAALLAGADRACPDEAALYETLLDLEDRGLLGWDRDADRYDLHPIVRGVAWVGLDPADRRRTCALLEHHFAALPPVPDRDVDGLDALTPTLELFRALIGQDRYDDAHRLFFDRLATPLLRWLDAHRLRVQLLESLFPNGTGRLPSLQGPEDQAQVANALSLSYRLSGRPGPAAVLSRMDVALLERDPAVGRRDLGPGRGTPLGRGLRNLAIALCLTGELREADKAARRAVAVDRSSTDAWASYWEALDLGWLGWVWARTGRVDDADRCFRRAVRIMACHDKPLSQARLLLSAAWLAFWREDQPAAEELLGRSVKLCDQCGDREKLDAGSRDREWLTAERLRAQLLLSHGLPGQAEEVLHAALLRARALHLIQEEVSVLTSLADLRRQQGRLSEAEELLGDVWSWVEFGPYRLEHADARLVLARIQQSAGRLDEAFETARRSYDLAWCDGSVHCYHWGVQAAGAQLQALGKPSPVPASSLESSPLVDVEIDPPDAYFVGPGAP